MEQPLESRISNEMSILKFDRRIQTWSTNLCFTVLNGYVIRMVAGKSVSIESE